MDPILVTVLAIVSTTSVANAWETDQLTDRSVPLEDVTDRANARMNQWLDEATVRTNDRLACAADPERTHDVLVDEIARGVGKVSRVPGRGFPRGLGYRAWSAWIENGGAPHREFPEREDIFGGLPSTRSFVLACAGTCSTIHLAGQLVGTDKTDHFLDTGHAYYIVAHRRGEEAAVRWGTRTENTWLGWWSSSAFSFSDLYANWQGYLFYRRLFDPHDGLFVLEDGCARRVRDFDWADWVDWRWDEVLYPTTYKPGVARWLKDKLAAEADHLCVDVATWGPEVEARVADAVAESDAPWLGERSREREDPFDINSLCSGIEPN